MAVLVSAGVPVVTIGWVGVYDCLQKVCEPGQDRGDKL